jgi:GT2 family glycosyltransferase
MPPTSRTIHHAPRAAVDLSIIIVSWNVWDLLRACLQSIEQVSRSSVQAQVRHFGPVTQQQTLEVIVVDNASQDVTVDGVQARFPWVRLITSAENLGFTRGNNLGYQHSQGQALFFLNPDTELVAQPPSNAPAMRQEVAPDFTTNALWQLYELLCTNPQVGMVGPQLRYADNSWQNSRRRFPTPLTGFFESTWLGRAWPQNRWLHRMHMLDWPADLRHDVDWLVGAAMLARREALESVRISGDTGPFDEGFFMYSEELDLCQRVKQAGWRILYAPEALVIHYEGRSSEQVVAARHIYFNTSKVRYYGKYFGTGWAEGLRAYLLFEFGIQFGVEQIKYWLGHKRTLRRARMSAYRSVLASGLRSTP